jgi:transcriptional regulator with XRE-family HTH domain
VKLVKKDTMSEDNKSHESSFLKSLGENIASLRKGKNFTQMQLSNKCNIEKSNLVRIEKGRTNPTTLTLFRIGQALEITVGKFFMGL